MCQMPYYTFTESISFSFKMWILLLYTFYKRKNEGLWLCTAGKAMPSHTQDHFFFTLLLPSGYSLACGAQSQPGSSASLAQ